MNGKQLKNSILQWAIQGKLVPQDPNDEPASVLLERIRVEKEKLIKEKKIKKDKNESIIYRGEDNSYYEKFLATGEVKCIDEEIPFEIPATWEWCRLGYIFSHCTGKALNGTNRKGNLYTYITTSNLYWDRFELSSLKEMYFTEEELGKCTATKGDLLVCEGGDIGRSAIWNYDYNIRIQNHIHKLRSYIPLCTRFFYYVMYLYKGIGYIGGKGIGIQGLSSGALHNILIPTPSINEQKRIISQIEAIMPIAVKYEKSQEELNQLKPFEGKTVTDLYNAIKNEGIVKAVAKPILPFYGGKIWVLTNKNTASACEPLVDFLKVNNLATIIGEKTAGKMLSAKSFPIDENYELYLPIGNYYTAQNFWIEQNGVEPNIAIKSENALDKVSELISK